jgi:hypothetical protein
MPMKLNRSQSFPELHARRKLSTIYEEDQALLSAVRSAVTMNKANILVTTSKLVRDGITKQCTKKMLKKMEWVELSMEIRSIFSATLRVYPIGFFDEKVASLEVVTILVEPSARRLGIASAIIWTAVSALCNMDVGVDCIFCQRIQNLNDCSKDVWGFCRRILERCSGTKWKPCWVNGCAGIRMNVL